MHTGMVFSVLHTSVGCRFECMSGSVTINCAVHFEFISNLGLARVRFRVGGLGLELGVRLGLGLGLG